MSAALLAAIRNLTRVVSVTDRLQSSGPRFLQYLAPASDQMRPYGSQRYSARDTVVASYRKATSDEDGVNTAP